MNELIKEKCGIDFEKITDVEEARKLAEAKEAESQQDKEG